MIDLLMADPASACELDITKLSVLELYEKVELLRNWRLHDLLERSAKKIRKPKDPSEKRVSRAVAKVSIQEGIAELGLSLSADILAKLAEKPKRGRKKKI